VEREHHRDARDGGAIADVDLARVQTLLELLATQTQPLARLLIDSLIPFALARGMGRPHSPQRRTPRIARRLRVRDGLAASWLCPAGHEHGASYSATTIRHRHLTVTI
jgi:hypothetical protein